LKVFLQCGQRSDCSGFAIGLDATDPDGPCPPS